MIARRSKGHLRLVTAARSDTHEPYFMAVWRCEFYVSEHLADNITLKKLSEISGLHQRSLLVAFNRITGTSPKAYVRRLRLQRVHDALQKSRHRRRSIITDLARECGFGHLGHFGQAYRAMFGESPSDTLLMAVRHHDGASVTS